MSRERKPMPHEPDKKDNPEKLKTLYVVEFWRQNNDWDHRLPPLTLIGKRHIKAYSEKQALEELKVRARKNARTLGRKEDHELVSMLIAREDISILVKKTTDTRLIDRSEKESVKDEMFSKTMCHECGGVLDDDYCQDCGWRRQSWIERAMSKQGKAEPSEEQ